MAKKTRIISAIACLTVFMGGVSIAQTVVLDHHDAVVWSQTQTIRGRLEALFAPAGILHVGTDTYPLTITPDSTFVVTVSIGEGVTPIVATVEEGGVPFRSDTLLLTLGYELRPEITGWANVQGRTVELIASVLDNPGVLPLTYTWTQDSRNPQTVSLTVLNDSSVAAEIPIGAPSGEYFFNVRASHAGGDTGRARTCVIVTADSVRSFDVRVDHAAWIDDAVVYEVSTPFFTDEGTFASVAKKIPELKELGVTALWLQPVTTTTEPCQGYHVLDYFGLRPNLGSPQDLRDLVEQAHAQGMRVMLDIVPNHTTLYHPYAQDAIQFGPRSHYYDFYQRTIDSSLYAWAQNVRVDGLMQFVYYFWDVLVNLNYDNPEVRTMMIKAGQYWIEEFDIDGYRIDAVWGVDDRRSEFMQEWRLALKRIKPEVFLLGETKATWTSSFDQRYDAAFDWARDQWWISLWAWAVPVGSRTPSLFTETEGYRSTRLRNALTNQGFGYPAHARILRFMENNDTDRFRVTDGLARTRMVAALMFSVAGIPLLYNGQEIGWPEHPYSCTPIFQDELPIRSLDAYGLFSYYQTLARLRASFDALRSEHWEELPVLADRMEGSLAVPTAFTFAYRRWSGESTIVGVINMGDSAVTSRIVVPTAKLDLDSARTYYLTDLLTNEAFPVTVSTLDTFAVPLQPFTTRLLALADSVLITTVDVDDTPAIIADFSLEQNYPNPFNASATIRYTLPRQMRARLAVYDLLGREIAVLADGVHVAGVHSVRMNGSPLSSGVYFYRLETDDFVEARRMTLLK